MHFVVGVLQGLDFGHQSVLFLQVSSQGCAFCTDFPLVADPHLLSSLVLLVDLRLVAGYQVPLPFLVVDLGLVVPFAHGDLVGVVEEVRAGLVQISLLVGGRHHALSRSVGRHSALHGLELSLSEGRTDGVKRSPRGSFPEGLRCSFVGVGVGEASGAVALEAVSIHQLILF